MRQDLPLKPICLAALEGDKLEQARLVDAIRNAINQLEGTGMVYLGLIAIADDEGYLRAGELDDFRSGRRAPSPDDWFHIFTPIVRGAVLDEKDYRQSLLEMVRARLLNLVKDGVDLGGALRYVIWDDEAQP
jgi:hypothetical protein